jgi:Mn2+/Fe2+ NRAMP family transporter
MTAVACLPVLAGVDVLKLTNISMVVSAASLPVVVLPLLVIMNDRRYLRDYCNGWVANTAVTAIVLLAGVLAVVSFPLLIAGGG